MQSIKKANLKKRVSTPAILMAAAILLMIEICSFWTFYIQIKSELRHQVQEGVKSENEEAVGPINARIEAKQDWLDTVAGMMGIADSLNSVGSDRCLGRAVLY